MLRPEIPWEEIGYTSDGGVVFIAPAGTELPPPPPDPETCPHPPEERREKSDRPNRHGVFFTWDVCGLCGEQTSPYEIDSVL